MPPRMQKCEKGRDEKGRWDGGECAKKKRSAYRRVGKERRRGRRVHVVEEGEKLEQRVETEKDGAIPIEM